MGLKFNVPAQLGLDVIMTPVNYAISTHQLLYVNLLTETLAVSDEITISSSNMYISSPSSSLPTLRDDVWENQQITLPVQPVLHVA